MSWKEQKQWLNTLANLEISRTKVCICCNSKKHCTEFVWTPTSVDNRSHVCADCKSFIDTNDLIIKQILHDYNYSIYSKT